MYIRTSADCALQIIARVKADPDDLPRTQVSCHTYPSSKPHPSTAGFWAGPCEVWSHDRGLPCPTLPSGEGVL